LDYTIGGTLRRYCQHPSFDIVADDLKRTAIHAELNKRNVTDASRLQLNNILGRGINTVPDVAIQAGVSYLPCIAQDIYQPVYDGINRVGGGIYPPAHVYANTTITVMRQIVDRGD